MTSSNNLRIEANRRFRQAKTAARLLRADPSGRQLRQRYRAWKSRGQFSANQAITGETHNYFWGNYVPQGKVREVLIESERSEKSPYRGRVAITAHIFYDEFVEPLLTGFRALRVDADLFVSTPSEKISRTILAQAHSLPGNVDVVVCENTGRNFAPLFVEIFPKLVDYEFFAHVHSKRSQHSSARQQIEGWTKAQWDFCLFDNDVIERCLALLQAQPDLALAYPDVSDYLPSFAFSWLKNEGIAREWFLKHDIEFAQSTFPYPAGGMFWARTSALSKVHEAANSYDKFPPEAGQIDGTFQHFIERLVGVLPLTHDKKHLVFDLQERNFSTDTSYIWKRYRSQTAAQALDAIEHADSVSFDFFDTLQRREIAFVDIAKLLVGEAVKERSGLAPADYVALRNQVELKIRASFVGGEVTLADICRELGTHLGIEGSELEALEIRFELEQSLPRVDVVKLLVAAMSKGKKVSILSDTYYPASAVRRFANKIGIPSEVEILASSELGVRKDRGDLWEYLISQRRLRPETHFHFGDNRVSDEQVPGDFAIRCMGLPNCYDKWEMFELPQVIRNESFGGDFKMAQARIVSAFGDSPFLAS